MDGDLLNRVTMIAQTEESIGSGLAQTEQLGMGDGLAQTGKPGWWDWFIGSG